MRSLPEETVYHPLTPADVVPVSPIGNDAEALASFKDDPWTGMDGRPAIVSNAYGDERNAYGDERNVYGGARLGHNGITKSLPADGEPIVMSSVERDGTIATINLNGVLIIKN